MRVLKTHGITVFWTAQVGSPPFMSFPLSHPPNGTLRDSPSIRIRVYGKAQQEGSLAKTLLLLL
ncbi:MAG: hypothetical protein HQL78_14305 [Magnetococcales bacterium]|nr:hypothetical protein [Magnetococcales bacterium]